jgi:hypothetical protein
MRLTTVKKEANLNALADRLYTNLTPDSRKQAVAAILKANPLLAQEGALRPGEVLKEVVRTYGQQLSGGLDTAQADIKDQEALLKQREVAAAIKAAPAAGDLAKNLAKALQDRRTAYTAEAKTLDGVLKEVAKDLDSLS